LRWAGDASARLLGARSGGDLTVEAEGVLRGARALQQVAAGPEANETDWVSLGSFLGALGLRRDVVEVGLDFPVGIGGKRLSAAQRQKLDLARALVKRPDLLLLNQSTSLLDSSAQAKVMSNILKSRAGRGVIWVLSHAEQARQFERVLVLRAGRVVAQGAPSELDKPGSILHQQAAAQ